MASKHTFSTLMRRLGAAGFKREFARTAVLPDWWDASAEADPRLLSEVEARVARFLGAPLAIVRDPSAALTSPAYAGAQLRRVRDIDRDRLGPAIHAALKIAAAVVRNTATPEVQLLPTDPRAWRSEISRSNAVLRLDDLLDDLWNRGIPVVHVDSLPKPAFQAIACVVAGRPVVLICRSVLLTSRIFAARAGIATQQFC